jgi:hypothetical protein
MSLRRSPSHAALGAGEGHQVQLFALPAPWRTLGVLRVRNGSDRWTPGEYGRVHLGRQDAAHRALQDLRMRHALGTACPRGRWQARCQSEQLRSASSSACSGAPLRWSGHLEIHRLRGTAAVEHALVVAIGVLALANTLTSTAVLRAHTYEPRQKILQVLLVWLLPILGIVFVWSFLRGSATERLTTDLADRTGPSVGLDEHVNVNTNAADVGGFGEGGH